MPQNYLNSGKDGRQRGQCDVRWIDVIGAPTVVECLTHKAFIIRRCMDDETWDKQVHAFGDVHHGPVDLKGESDMSRGLKITNPLTRTVKVVVKEGESKGKTEMVLPGKTIFMPLRRGEHKVKFYIVQFDENGEETTLGEASILQKPSEVLVPVEVDESMPKPFRSLADMIEDIEKKAEKKVATV